MNNRIKELEKEISEAANAYYNGSEIISDDEYDALVYELNNLDPHNLLLTKVGSEPVSEWKKEKHLFSLGSLSKVNAPNEMENWINSHLANKEVLVSDKLDGLSIGCQYENGKLVKAILRGNGYEGENILVNILKMHGVVKYISNFTGVLRGEIILTKSNHQDYFPSYSNPRNAASGICRRFDGQGCEHLSILFYQVLGTQDFLTEEEQFTFLKKAGCKVPNYKLCKTANDVSLLWQDYQDNIRKTLDYEIDGLVVACNNLDFQKSLGEVSLRPKGKISFKFANQFVRTTVKDITWSVGASGRITPVCWVEPVNLLGSTVEKASVYNSAYIQKLGLDIGADVLICKANEVIPRIEKVVKSTGKIADIPNRCPECNSVLITDGEYLQCDNSNRCLSQIVGRLSNWIKELNILEWGDSLLTKLVESGKVTTVADLYHLSVDELSSIDRMGVRSAKKCFDNLWKVNEIPLDLFIGALSIPLIGSSTIRQIMNYGFDTLEVLLDLDCDDLFKVPGIGFAKAHSLYNGLKKSNDIICKILDSGIKIKTKVIGKLTGKKICFTGTMVNKRQVLEKMASDNGAEVKGSVGKDLSFLVINDLASTSSKAVSARKFGIRLISEDEFLEFIK
jgi:DNA ligase (NAD+)